MLPCELELDRWLPEHTKRGPKKKGTTHSYDPEAIEACGYCKIRDVCLSTALRGEKGKPATNRYGIFGGLVPAERAALDPAA